MKQIKTILNNPTAVTVIEIFEQNINELDEQITALSTVKSILARFIGELQKKADIHLKFDLLNDKSMLAVMGTLPFSENKINSVKEKLSMEDLNKASETLNKFDEKNVRVVYMPPMTIASAGCSPGETEKFKSCLNYVVKPYQEGRITMRDVLKKFIDDVDLFKIKPDARIFGFQNHGDQYFKGHKFDINGMWASIPDDLNVPLPLNKLKFYGGLYVKCSSGFDIGSWLENNDYKWAPEDGINRPIMDEFIDPFNRFGLENTWSEETGSFVTDNLWPIKKLKKLTEADKKRLTKLLDDTISQKKPTEIDLTTMEKHGDFELKYEDGAMLLKIDGYPNGAGMKTPQQFKAPLKIELRAKTDLCSIVLAYAKGNINLKWHNLHDDPLPVNDIADGEMYTYPKCGAIPIGEFVDIEWILAREFMAVKVNGELRHIGSHYGYIKAFEENPGFSLLSPVTITTEIGSTITTKSLRVIEL
jgi:hypothetical protein